MPIEKFGVGGFWVVGVRALRRKDYDYFTGPYPQKADAEADIENLIGLSTKEEAMVLYVNCVTGTFIARIT